MSIPYHSQVNWLFSSNAYSNSFCRRHPDIIGSQDLRVRDLGLNIDALQTCLFLRCGQEDQVVLIVESSLQSLQAGFKTDQSRRTKRVALSARFLGNFRESRQSYLERPRTSRIRTSARDPGIGWRPCALPAQRSTGNDLYLGTCRMPDNFNA